MFSLRKLTFLLLVFFTENPVFSTDSNLFLDPFPTDELDDTSLSASAFLLPWSSSPDYIIGATDGISENESSGSLFTDDDSLLLLTSCVDNNNPQQQLLQKNKARAKTKRDGFGSTVCPQNGAPLPPVPLPVPQFPDLLNSIIGPSDGERWKDEEGDFAGAAVSMNTAEFYCALWTSKPRVYKKPVCGSGNYEDMVRVARAFYSYVANSRLVTPLTFASCPPDFFFCCLQWLPNILLKGPNNPFTDQRDIDPSGLGTGTSCESLFDKGWQGLNPQAPPEGPPEGRGDIFSGNN